MAKAAAKGKGAAKEKDGAPAKAGSRKAGNQLLVILTLLALVPFSLPTILLLACGMLPTMAAALSRRGAWIAVGGLNFAGLSPWLVELWFGHHTLEYAASEIFRIMPLIVAWLAAGVGWLLHLSMSPLVGVYTAVTAKRRIMVLIATQKRLVEEWGNDVITRDQPQS
jgi:hypothetical protein